MHIQEYLFDIIFLDGIKIKSGDIVLKSLKLTTSALRDYM